MCAFVPDPVLLKVGQPQLPAHAGFQQEFDNELTLVRSLANHR